MDDFEDFLRIWTVDAQGNRVMRGLTVEETSFYQEHVAKMAEYEKDEASFSWASVDEMREAEERWLALHEKHEVARLEAIDAEAELRGTKPPIN